MTDQPSQQTYRQPRALRVAVAITVALVHCIGSYMLVRAASDPGLVSFTFLIVQPAAITAFVCYFGDIDGQKPKGFYLMVPAWLTLLAIMAGALFLHEGVICILMLTPLWLGIGAIAARCVYAMRTRIPPTATLGFGFLALPLAMMAVEPSLPRPWSDHTVTRSIVIASPPETIWPMMRGIGAIAPGEGVWTVAQSMIGLPRPVGARLIGQGVGARREARWQRGVHFAEVITRWAPPSPAGAAISWRFAFADSTGWDFTDPHLRPDSAELQVLDGGYRLDPAGPGHWRLSLTTHYRCRTPVDAYAALWGELLLGDVERNVLAIIAQRATAYPPIAARSNGVV